MGSKDTGFVLTLQDNLKLRSRIKHGKMQLQALDWWESKWLDGQWEPAKQMGSAFTIFEPVAINLLLFFYMDS